MVLVKERKNHHTVSWIPESYWNKLHIIPDDSDKLDFKPVKPLVVIEHGAMDITSPCKDPEERDCYSLLYADYYLCSTRESYEGLLKKGKNAYYTGMAISDLIIGEQTNPDALIYVPDHGIIEPLKKQTRIYSDNVLPLEELKKIAKLNNCNEIITSAIEEDSRINQYHNVRISNRNHLGTHSMKMRKLLSRAKLVYEEANGTFSSIAKSMGIKVLPDIDRFETLTDGKCRERILSALDDIIKKEKIMERTEKIWNLQQLDMINNGTDLIHLVMPHYNGKNDLIRAYISIMERTPAKFVLTIIDDNSNENDAGKQFIRRLYDNPPPNVNIVINNENIGVTKNLNYGFSIYPSMDCIRLDADIEIQSRYWLNEMISFMEKNKNVGVCSPIGIEPDFTTIQTAGQWLVISPEDNLTIPSHGAEVFDKSGIPRHEIGVAPIEVDACLGCCAYYRREVIDKLGGVDENYFGWVEDNDFCIGARSLGYKCFVLPQVSYCHHHHAGKRSYEETMKILRASEKRFIEKWGFSLYEPAPYWDEVVKRHKGTEIFWRYNEK